MKRDPSFDASGRLHQWLGTPHSIRVVVGQRVPIQTLINEHEYEIRDTRVLNIGKPRKHLPKRSHSGILSVSKVRDRCGGV